MPLDSIVVTGAREHNLKDIDITIPRDKFVVITGVSGSGKSSLAFDTIYAEGQRRYVESLSAYARQFLGLMEKPDVDYIEGLSPAISIDQKGVSKNPRSTVATVTEIYDYLRLLFARAGIPHCPHCGQVIRRQTVQQIVDAVLAEPTNSRGMLLAPLIRHQRGEHKQVIEEVRQSGFVRVRVDGAVREIEEQFELDRYKWHDIDVVVDRIVVPAPDDDEVEQTRRRISDSVEQALRLGAGIILFAPEERDEVTFSQHFACPNPDHPPYSVGEIEPRNFSFNSPHGACPSCTGLGVQMEIDEALVVPNRKLSINEGAILPYQRITTSQHWYRRRLASVGEAYGFTLDAALETLDEAQWSALMRGTEGQKVPVEYTTRSGRERRFEVSWEGVLTNLERRHKETESEWVRGDIERYMVSVPCPTCQGARVKADMLAVTVDGRSIVDTAHMAVGDALVWIEHLRSDATPLAGREREIAHQILQEIEGRLTFLRDVGLGYLTLDRPSATLAGGEGQRIRLATQIGSALMGVLYVCDEPSIGLHPIDNERLIRTLSRLRDLGNTVLVVEHDEAMMWAADHLIDLGPGAGEHGGTVIATGSPKQVARVKRSITGQYLSGKRRIPMPESRRARNGNELVVRGAAEHNLKQVDVHFPLGLFIGVTGMSGSGKSTLVNEILAKRLAYELHRARERPGKHGGMDGIEHVDKAVVIDQSPIGRTPRSNPATYTGLFTTVRDLFASVPEARARGYKPGRFSFNVKGGRCEECSGDGYNVIEMQFLPEVTVACEACHGDRYNRDTLEIQYRGKSISEVLNLTVTEALEFFDAIPAARRRLETLHEVGLGYIRLGQPATTLSGGEAQRVKLATELSRRATGQTVYILDEPTTGLSFPDVAALLGVLQALVDAGNTVIVIEHHLDVIKNADWLIDLGPEGGENGGQVIAAGPPEEIATIDASATGRFLRDVLESHGGGVPVAEPSALDESPGTSGNSGSSCSSGSSGSSGNGATPARTRPKRAKAGATKTKSRPRKGARQSPRKGGARAK
ncbi:MAG: excinuclease ABC subunit UvrA [Dehalococcoidia bacterium]|nr:excinuclease ABC subunit UvrA [Dehalococcoidia bacterium]